MTREACLTQKRLEGEILKLLEGKRGQLYKSGSCAFCKKCHGVCPDCPLDHIYPGLGCVHDDFEFIGDDMAYKTDDAIPGALAIYMWLEEL